MHELINSLRPIISGLLGAGFVYILIRLTKSESKKINNTRILEYSTGCKIFTTLMFPFSIFIIYAASHARSDQIAMAALVAIFFIVATVFMTYQVFFVRFSYDDQYIYYSSPFMGNAKAPWSDLIEVGYSNIFKSDFIVFKKIGRIWCSNMVNGYEELGEFIHEKSNELFPDNES